MAADPITLPVRPLNVGALLEAAEAAGLSDEQIGRLIHRLWPESLLPSWGPSWNPTPNADAHGRIRSIDLDRIGGYADALEDLPLPHEIDQSNARAATYRAMLGERR